MRTLKRRGRLYLIVLLAALASAGMWGADKVHSLRDRAEVTAMMKKTRTVCAGRYLIDVPALAEVNLLPGTVDGFDIQTVEETAAEFHERMAARVAEIEARQTAAPNATEGGMVEARELLVPGMVGRTFIHGRSRGYLIEEGRRVYYESVSVESHGHTNGVSFSISASSADEHRAREAETLLARLQVRGEDEIPSVSGFCVSRAVFVDPLPSHTTEQIVMRLTLREHPEMRWAFEIFGGAQSEPGLLARIARIDASMEAKVLSRMTKLREGKRRINGLDGEEVLVRAREANFATTYGFSWEAPGSSDDLMRPLLSFELETGVSQRAGGKPVDSSLHEDALLALWDSISSSIRLRKPGLGPQPSPHSNTPEPERQLAAH